MTMKTSNSVLDAIAKLPRYVRVLSSNGIDETNAIVLVTNNTITKESKGEDKPEREKGYNAIYCHRYYLKNMQKLLDYSQRYYIENRDKILEQKRAHNALPEVMEKRARYAKEYYLRTKDKRKRKW